MQILFQRFWAPYTLLFHFSPLWPGEPEENSVLTFWSPERSPYTWALYTRRELCQHTSNTFRAIVPEENSIKCRKWKYMLNLVYLLLYNIIVHDFIVKHGYSSIYIVRPNGPTLCPLFWLPYTPESVEKSLQENHMPLRFLPQI